MKTYIRSFLFFLITLILTSPSYAAEIFQFDSPIPGTLGGGQIDHLNIEYNASLENLKVEVQAREFNNMLPSSFFIVLTDDGLNPVGRSGIVPIFYFDGTDANNPRLNVFSYNGENARDSYQCGSMQNETCLPADRIFSSLDLSLIHI